MNVAEWQIDGLADEKARHETRRRNEVFRRRMQDQHARRRARMRLKMASFAAVLAWILAGIMWMR